jgi:hypothetical protein
MLGRLVRIAAVLMLSRWPRPADHSRRHQADGAVEIEDRSGTAKTATG